MPEKKVLRIDALLAEIAGELEIGGVLHDVKQLTLGQHQTLETAPAAQSVDVMRAMAGDLVPTLSADQIKSLTIPVCKAIAMLAGAGIDAVEALYPNAVSPASQSSPG